MPKAARGFFVRQRQTQMTAVTDTVPESVSIHPTFWCLKLEDAGRGSKCNEEKLAAGVYRSTTRYDCALPARLAAILPEIGGRQQQGVV